MQEYITPNTKPLIIYTFDENNKRIQFTTTYHKARVSGFINNTITIDPNVIEIGLEPDNLRNNNPSYMNILYRQRNIYILQYIEQYFNICDGNEEPPIEAPCVFPDRQNPDLKTSTLTDKKTRNINDIWADFIDTVELKCPKHAKQQYNIYDLCCLMSCANYMDIKQTSKN